MGLSAVTSGVIGVALAVPVSALAGATWRGARPGVSRRGMAGAPLA